MGSSILTILIVLLILRYRRKKRRESATAAETGSGGYGYGDEKDGAAFPRPETAGSWDPAAMRDIKEPIPNPPPAAAAAPPEMTARAVVNSSERAMAPAAAVAPAPAAAAPATAAQRFQSVRIVDVSRNASSSTTSSKKSTAPAAVGQRLQKLGLSRRATTTTTADEAATGDADDGEPLPVTLSSKPKTRPVVVVDAPRGKRKNENAGGSSGGKGQVEEGGDEVGPATGSGRARADTGVSVASAKTPTFSVFPKIDPDPQGTAANAASQQQQAQQAQSGKQQIPTLQSWLQTQSVVTATAEATDRGQQRMSLVGRARARLSEVKWPLQDTGTKARSSQNWVGAGVARAATDASSRYSRQIEEDLLEAERETAPGGGPVRVVQNPEFAASPVFVGKVKKVGGSQRGGVGLPGSVRPKG